jgi:hypothetical protein
MTEQGIHSASNHRRIAVMVFNLLSALKVIAALLGVRIILLALRLSPSARGIFRLIAEHRVPVGLVLIIFYGSSFLLCRWIARNVEMRRLSGRNTAYFYSFFHVAGIVLALRM